MTTKIVRRRLDSIWRPQQSFHCRCKYVWLAISLNHSSISLAPTTSLAALLFPCCSCCTQAPLPPIRSLWSRTPAAAGPTVPLSVTHHTCNNPRTSDMACVHCVQTIAPRHSVVQSDHHHRHHPNHALWPSTRRRRRPRCPSCSASTAALDASGAGAASASPPTTACFPPSAPAAATAVGSSDDDQ